MKPLVRWPQVPAYTGPRAGLPLVFKVRVQAPGVPGVEYRRTGGDACQHAAEAIARAPVLARIEVICDRSGT